MVCRVAPNIGKSMTATDLVECLVMGTLGGALGALVLNNWTSWFDAILDFKRNNRP